MAEADFTLLTDSLSSGSLKRGVTAGITPPSGGGSFIYGFNSVDVSVGAAGLFTNQANFVPTPAMKGGSARGCLQRGPSGGNANFAPFLFIGLQGATVHDSGYLLGLADADPSHIVLRKGSIETGLPDVGPGVSGVLRRSTATFPVGTWLHLRLDMAVNANGDVVLSVFANDLTAHPIGGAYTWAAVPGLTQFIDDALSVNSGSAPFTSGRMGFGFYTKDISRRGYFDQLEFARQT